MNTCTGQLQRIRVTLDFEVFEDFDVNNINFHKVFQIDGNENLTVSIENRSEKVENLWDTVYDTMIWQISDAMLYWSTVHLCHYVLDRHSVFVFC